uniref:Uncharacterized protein n=1 Tax=Cannabis sativa TaxID=3483 RepID=A0A803QYA5_CANSA
MGAGHFSLQDEVMITQRNGDIGAYISQETNYIEERKIWALVPLRKEEEIRQIIESWKLHTSHDLVLQMNKVKD